MSDKYTDTMELIQSDHILCKYCDEGRLDRKGNFVPKFYHDQAHYGLHLQQSPDCLFCYANEPDLDDAFCDLCPFGFGPGGEITQSKDGYCMTGVNNSGFRCIGCKERYGYESKNQKDSREAQKLFKKKLSRAQKETHLPFFRHDRKGWKTKDDGTKYYDWFNNEKLRRHMDENDRRQAQQDVGWDYQPEYDNLDEQFGDGVLWVQCEICPKWRVALGSDVKYLKEKHGVFRCKFLEGCTCQTRCDEEAGKTDIAEHAWKADRTKKVDKAKKPNGDANVKSLSAKEEHFARFKDAVTAGHIHKSDVVQPPTTPEGLDQAAKRRVTIRARMRTLEKFEERVSTWKGQFVDRLAKADEVNDDMDVDIDPMSESERADIRQRIQKCDADLKKIKSAIVNNAHLLADLDGNIQICCRLLGDEYPNEDPENFSPTDDHVNRPALISELIDAYTSPNGGGSRASNHHQGAPSLAGHPGAPHSAQQQRDAPPPLIPP